MLTQAREERLIYLWPEDASVLREAAVDASWSGGELREPRRSAWNSVDEAVAWARARAPEIYVTLRRRVHEHIVVRAGDIPLRFERPVRRDEATFAAGTVEKPGTTGRWPDDPSSSTIERVPAFGGTVHVGVFEDPSEKGERVGYVARVERLHPGGTELVEFVGPRWQRDLPSALAWANEQAVYVILTLGAPDWEYWSAGEGDLPDIELPRWHLDPTKRSAGRSFSRD